MKTRIVITGFGVMSPCGNTPEETWGNIVNGRSGISLLTRFNTEKYKCKIGGEVKKFEALHYGITQKEVNSRDLSVQYGLAAAHQAILDSGIQLDEHENLDIGAIMGVGMGSFATTLASANDLLKLGPDKVSPRAIPYIMANGIVSDLSIKYKLNGITQTVNTACASALHGLANAIMAIETGRSKVMLFGGAEAISELPYAGFMTMKALSRQYNDNPTQASRPFTINRDGFVMSEGGVVGIIEDLEHAKARDAKIYAEIAGFGLSSDAYHLTKPSSKGATLAMARALKDAGISAKEIDYINLHGTSTPEGDPVEITAIKEVFEGYAFDVDISSTKSTTGHLLGAAGALESFVCCMAMLHNEIPPTINLTEENMAPDCNLNHIFGKSKQTEVNYTMNNSYGFGGPCASVIFKKYTDK